MRLHTNGVVRDAGGGSLKRSLGTAWCSDGQTIAKPSALTLHPRRDTRRTMTARAARSAPRRCRPHRGLPRKIRPRPAARFGVRIRMYVPMLAG